MEDRPIFWAVFVFTFLSAVWIMPVPGCSQETPTSRTILGLYDSSEDFNRWVDNNMIHQNAEMVLNHLGMKVRLYDIHSGVPGDDVMKDVCGIFGWFLSDNMAHAEEFSRWFSQQVEQGKKLVLFKNSGVFKDEETLENVPDDVADSVYQNIGLRYASNWTDNPLVLEVTEKDSSMVEFERTLRDEVTEYETYHSIKSANKIYLKIRRNDIPDGESAVVVISPQGGFVLGHYALFMNYKTDRGQWRLNPFRYFQEAFQLENMPRYDTTTLFGRRILYVNIDGDGFRNVSDIDNSFFSGEIIRDEILKKYRIPTTVSFVVCEIDPRYFGSHKLEGIAKDIVGLPNVEGGVHGFAHPLDWDKQLVAFVIEGYSKKLSDLGENDIISESAYGDAAMVFVDREKYLNREIKEASDYLNQFILPEGKKVRVYQWSGNCRPPARAIDLVRELGMVSINGGDSRFDRAVPSYTGLSALTRQIEGRLQTYTSNANENIYTNLWNGPYDGYAKVIETFQETEYPSLVDSVPRRVKPINIYYHFYSGEKRPAVKALQQVYDYALSQNVIPIFTSEYISVVEGFHTGEVKRRDDGSWHFMNYGDCRTVRFDKLGLYPDLKRSQGILGYSQWHDVLYVHLAQGSDAILYLSGEKPKQPYLAEAANIIGKLELTQEHARFETHGTESGFFLFENMAPNTAYEIKVLSAKDGHELHAKKYKSKKNGALEIKIPVNEAVAVTLRKMIK